MKKILLGVLIGLSLAAFWWFFAPIDYYEYDALSANECLAGEQYDEEYKVCYFDFYCETEAECALVDEKYGDVLDALANEYVASETDHVPHGSKVVEVTEEQTSESVTPPSIHQKETVEPSYPNVSELMSFLLPTTKRAQIVEIVAESDGEDNTLAYVEPIDAKGATWKMAYDPIDTYDAKEKYKDINGLLTTLIHEYAHVLALDNTQVSHVGNNVEYIECNNGETILNEGCAQNASYINAFITKYWTEEDRGNAFAALENNNEEDFAYELFTKRPNGFVTEYAATNAVEDMAESFALFVLKPRPTTNTVADQKINFFYNYPELVTLRNHMRGGTAKILEAVGD